MIGRVPIRNVRPAPGDDKWPAKAVAGEAFEVSATGFGEGRGLIASAYLRGDSGYVLSGTGRSGTRES